MSRGFGMDETLRLRRELANVPYLSQEQREEFDLQFLWKVVYSKRWWIFTIAALTLASSSIYVLRLPNVYTATTKILVERSDKSSAYTNPEILVPEGGPSQYYYKTRVEILKSRAILEQAAEQLDLVRWFNVQTVEQAARMLREKISVEVLKETQILELAVTDRDPKLAAEYADAITDVFVKESWRERLFMADQIAQWFPDEAKTLEKSSPIQQLRKFDNEDAVMALPSIANNLIINNLKQELVSIDAQMRELSKRYTLEHPKMKELVARSNFLKTEMNAQIDKIISGLKSGLAGEFGVSNTKIIERAEIPTKPSGPKRLQFILLCTLFALVTSTMVSSLLFYLDQSVRSEDDLRRIPITFLGYLPLVVDPNGPGVGLTSGDILLRLFTDARLMDEVTNFRAAILFSMPAERSKLFLCTSAIPEEGKTVVASTLGVSLAEAGEKVLLIDADMRKPALHEAFGLENKVGLSNCLVGSASTKEATQAIDKIEGLHILAAGEKTPNPAILLGSSALDRLIEELSSEYDRIIFDAPPALHIADALILASKVHGTVLVFRNGKVHRNMARKIKERILIAGGVVIGGIINGVDYRKLHYPYYYYYSRYNRYYRSRHSASESGVAVSTSVPLEKVSTDDGKPL